MIYQKPRQRNLLRYAIRASRLPPAPATRLAQILEELVCARADAQPLVQWAGAEARRFRQHLFLMRPLPEKVTGKVALLRADKRPVSPGELLGQLMLKPTDQAGIDPSIVRDGLAIRFREGGESIRPLHNRHTKTLRNLLQERAVVPWMRDRIPLLYAGDELVAVADLWVSADHAKPHGYRVDWTDRPPLY